MIDKSTKELLAIKARIEKQTGWRIVGIEFGEQDGRQIILVKLGALGRRLDTFPSEVDGHTIAYETVGHTPLGPSLN